MSEILAAVEQAYVQGQADYEAALLQAAAQEPSAVDAAYFQGLADYEAALVAQASAQSLGLSHEQAYVQGLMDYESALVQQAASVGEGQDPALEEAYQLGVVRAEAQRLLELLDSGTSELSDELRDAHEKGVADYQAAVGTSEQAAVGTSEPATESSSGRTSRRGSAKN